MSHYSRRELLVRELQELYGAEQQLLIALPLMLGAATSPMLADAIRAHLGPKHCHVLRLEECLALLGASATAIPSNEMDRLVREPATIVHVKHYEMVAYAACLRLAGALGEESIAMLLQLTLDETQRPTTAAR